MPWTRAALLVVALAFLTPTTTGCFLPLLLGGGDNSQYKACEAAVADLTVIAVQEPAVGGFDGRWHCLWTASGGQEMSENLELVSHGNTVTRVGRDNWGNNITDDPQLTGDWMVMKFNDHAGLRAQLDPSGRLIDGKLIQWGVENSVCHESRYICKR